MAVRSSRDRRTRRPRTIGHEGEMGLDSIDRQIAAAQIRKQPYSVCGCGSDGNIQIVEQPALTRQSQE